MYPDLDSENKGLLSTPEPKEKEFEADIFFSNFILIVNPKFTELKNIGKFVDYAYDIKDEDILDYEIKFNEKENQPMELIIQLFTHHLLLDTCNS